jgi:signal transduction histidine kinase
MLPFIQSTYLVNLLECFSAGVVIMNVRGDVYAANETAGRMLAMPRQALLKSHFNGAVLERFVQSEEVRRFLENARKPDAFAAEMQARFRHPESGLRHYTLSISRLIEYGKVFGIVLQVGDVTHIYEMHEREKAMLEERSALQQERIDSLAQLSMAIAHQIRNPLMTIGGFAALLEKKAGIDETGAAFVRSIKEGAARLENVVKAVTQYTAPRQPQYRPCAMGEVVARALEMLPPLPSGVSMVSAPSWPDWFVEPDLTRDSLAELILNAVEATAAGGGSVNVSWTETDGECLVEVRDQGPGVSSENAPFLFDPFFTTKAVGVGMGLAKARRWMREQGGDVSVENSPSGGTMATLRLPRGCVLKRKGQ